MTKKKNSNLYGTYKTIGNPGDRTSPCAIVAFLVQENNLAVAAAGYNPDSKYPFDPNKGREIALRRAKTTLDRHRKGLENSKSLAVHMELDRGCLGDIISKTSVQEVEGDLTIVMTN
jgi:hypothetical protein